MSAVKILLIAAFVVLAGALAYFGQDTYLDLDWLKSQLGRASAYRHDHPVSAALLYAALYVVVISASIPGAGVLSLASGAIFGFMMGSLIVLFSATIGATVAFWVARYLFDDWVQSHMGDRLAKIREKFRADGAFYLFSIRLVPAFPFFVVNLVMGLTSIKTLPYIIATFLGMIVPSMVFVNAGTQLARLESVSGLLSPPIIASFLLLAAFPYAAKYFLKQLSKRRA
ncbi:MAG: TVP38/TMEM64 family protein [Gammaproteobacteria bacterium]|nr:TVP38/TMEM64 family protein [Gammaproteobacteria bacterium]